MESLHRYLEALGRQDWARLPECFSDDLHRTGPFGDVIEGGRAYADFLERTVGALANYALQVFRVRPLGPDAAVVELSETVDLEDGRHETPEVLLFDFDARGRICRVDVYIKQRPPAEG